MSMRKSELKQFIKETVHRAYHEAIGRGFSSATIQLQSGTLEASVHFNPYRRASFEQPAEGGDMEIDELVMNGVPTNLEDVLDRENAALQGIGEPPITDEDLIRRIEEKASEFGQGDGYHPEENSYKEF